MRIVSISDDFIENYGMGDREFMHKKGRPCIVVVRLRFCGKERDFAVPFRSNISPSTPKSQYFALPPRVTTRPRHHHEIHYIKMFPIEKRFQRRSRTEGNAYYKTVKRILDENSRQIVDACQRYLEDYEKFGHPKYAVDIDRIIGLLKKET